MKISDISIFKELSTNSKNVIDEAAQFVSFRIGQPIIFNGQIPNKVFIIIEGEARLIISKDDEKNTIAKLGQGTILGLAPILCAKGFEEVIASTDIKSVALPDNLIVNLYKVENQFREYCNSTKFPSEIAGITELLIQKSDRTDIQFRKAFNLCMNNSKIETITNDSKLKTENDYKKFIGSSNFESKIFGDFINENNKFLIREPFNGRIISIRKELHNEFIKKSLDAESIKNNSLYELKDKDY